METLRCRSEKAVRLFAELDSKKGIGLIERKRQGLGKPAIIYVKNFAGRYILNKSKVQTLGFSKIIDVAGFCVSMTFGFRIS